MKDLHEVLEHMYLESSVYLVECEDMCELMEFSLLSLLLSVNPFLRLILNKCNVTFVLVVC